MVVSIKMSDCEEAMLLTDDFTSTGELTRMSGGRFKLLVIIEDNSEDVSLKEVAVAMGEYSDHCGLNMYEG